MSATRPVTVEERGAREVSPVAGPRGPRGRRASAVLLPLTGTVVLLAAWWALKIVKGWEAFILPSPLEVAATIVDSWSLLLRHTWVTLGETVAGFLLAVAVAVPVGVALAYSWVFDRMFSPILFGFNAVPKVAVAPLLIIWMGFGQLPKIVMVVLVSFFPIVLSTAAGLKSTGEELRELVRSLGASPWQAFRKVRLPSALPQVFVGLKVAISLAVIGAVIGEFVGAQEGLGYLIVVSGGTADTTLAFAALVLLAVISIALFYVLLAIERAVLPWAEEEA
jgi:NitT/TauT family transport system permease protein